MNKYLRTIRSRVNGAKAEVDVYDVIVAFGVTCPALQHAVKKVLCAGVRGNKTTTDDLNEAIISLQEALKFVEAEEPNVTPAPTPEPVPVPRRLGRPPKSRV